MGLMFVTSGGIMDHGRMLPLTHIGPAQRCTTLSISQPLALTPGGGMIPAICTAASGNETTMRCVMARTPTVTRDQVPERSGGL